MSVPYSAGKGASFALFACLISTLPSVAKAEGPLDAYLPKSGKIIGHVMQLGVAPEDMAIDRQFRVAVQNNMDWFKKYVTGQKSGVPLPYDRRMGVTEAQYNKLQHMHADFRPGAPIEITVSRGPDGRVSFASKDEKAAELAKVTFAADEKAAETPYGKLAIFNEIHQKDERAPVGIWNGAEWAKVEENGAPRPSAKIAFGKREPSGEGVMYYQVAPYIDHAEQSLVVFYKLD
jgi:hypothetical protein